MRAMARGSHRQALPTLGGVIRLSEKQSLKSLMISLRTMLFLWYNSQIFRSNIPIKDELVLRGRPPRVRHRHF